MGELPLHPAVVHLPLGLALVIPILALSLTVALWRGWLPGRAWAILVGLQVLLLGGGMLSMNSGEKEEERVEARVSESVIEAHEDMAKQFMAVSALVLVISGVGLFLGDTKKRWVALAVTVGSIAVAGQGLRVGHAGGELVYKHGAAAAYGAAATNPEGGAAAMPAAPADEHD